MLLFSWTVRDSLESLWVSLARMLSNLTLVMTMSYYRLPLERSSQYLLLFVCYGHPWAYGSGQNEGSGTASDNSNHCSLTSISLFLRVISILVFFSVLLFTLLWCPPSLKHSKYFLMTHYLNTGDCQHLPMLALYTNFKHLDEISLEWVRQFSNTNWKPVLGLGWFVSFVWFWVCIFFPSKLWAVCLTIAKAKWSLC